jgi:aspartyl-tRNA synthetase
MAVGARFPKVFEVGGIYRAENSNTARHLCEFTGLDMEMEILDDYHEVFDMLERLMLFIFNGLNERYAKEIELVRNVYPLEPFKLPPADQVPRINFAEGVEMLRAAGEALDDFDDLTTPQEKKLGQLVLEKYGSDFYTLDQFPLGIRPFCTMPSVHSKLSNSYDMFMRGQEILSGAQRVHTFELLVQRIKEMNMDPEADGLRDYVNAFKYGISPHGGGGLGLERVVQFFLGLPNIRLASLFPRDPGRVLP